MGYGRGHGLIMDNTYTVVNTVRTGVGQTSADLHEFNVINGGESALMTIYMPVHHDLSAYGITTGQGWILEDLSKRSILPLWRFFSIGGHWTMWILRSAM
jgi:hypothetical protein